jgi:hypothetical protein
MSRRGGSSRARVAGLLALPWLATACVTGRPSEPARVPAVLEPAFRPCVPGDGAATVQLFEDGKIVGSAEAEWVADDRGNWEVQVSNAVGSVLLSLKRQGHQIVATGPAAPRLPALRVDDEGFLEANGHRIAIRAHEVPCFLGYAMPRSWTSKVAAVETEGDDTIVTLRDPDRSVVVTAHGLNVGKRERVCADVSWTRWLVFRRTLTWCTDAGGKAAAELRGIEGYTIKWVRIDEERSS